MSQSKELLIANDIREQLGLKYLSILGAKEFTGTANSLRFKINNNSKGVTHVSIGLNCSNAYDVSFFENTKVKTEFEGISCDELRPTIEENTNIFMNKLKQSVQQRQELKDKFSAEFFEEHKYKPLFRSIFLMLEQGLDPHTAIEQLCVNIDNLEREMRNIIEKMPVKLVVSKEDWNKIRK